jgi:pyruvate/2-oxoglutarate dehydrogenase complex dihydrolipoamide dehydrogenase (E3) component
VLLPRHGADVDRQRAQEYVENGAAGDAAASPGWPLTPVASLEGEVVAANLLEGNHETPDYTGVPSAVFTIPELARVGLLEAEAREQGLDVDVRFTDRAGRREACRGRGAGRARLGGSSARTC